MTRKFTFLLMALMALAGLQGWAQRGYTYEKLTGTPDPTAEYVLGYQEGTNYYFHSSGESVNGMLLTDPATAEPKVYTISVYSGNIYQACYASNKYLLVSGSQVWIGSAGSMPFVYQALYLDNNGIQSVLSSGYYVYQDNKIVKASTSPTASSKLYFYKRTGSAAPTYAVTVTSDTEGCTASADKDEYEEGETVTLSYTADAFHYFTGYESSDVTITGSTFAMPANNVSVTAHFAAKPTNAISTLVTPEGAGSVSVTYQGNPITEAPAGITINLSYTVNSGFIFQNFSLTGAELNSDGVSFTMPENEVAVTANFTAKQPHTLTVQQPTEGGTITATPNGTVYVDDVITLDNTPAVNGVYETTHRLNHYQVVPETGTAYSVAPDVAQFTMPDCDVMVTGFFDKIYTVSASAYTAGGSAYAFLYGNDHTPVTKFVAGDHVYVRANADDGYRVKNIEFTPNTIEYSTSGNQYHFNMPASDVTVKVYFELIPKFNVTYSATGGSIYVDPVQNVQEGTTVNIYNYGGTNNHFKFNKDNLIAKRNDTQANLEITEASADFQYTFVMPASNVTVSMTFDEDPSYGITVDPELDGKISVTKTCSSTTSSTGNYYVGSQINLSYGEYQGYEFIDWDVTYVDAADGQTKTVTVSGYSSRYFSMPNGPVTISATYNELTSYDITINQTDGGTVKVQNGWEQDITSSYGGSTIILRATADEGYEFVNWNVVYTSDSYPFYTGNDNPSFQTMPDEGITVAAVFRELVQRNVNYYVNGTLDHTATPYVGHPIDITPATAPAGTQFYGWAEQQIETYETTEPTILSGNATVEAGDGDLNLYAVFKYEEEEQTAKADGSTWEKVNYVSDLKTGDNVIIAGEGYGYDYTLLSRESADAVVFKSSSKSIGTATLINGGFDANTVIFTVELSGSCLKLAYEDTYAGSTTLAYTDAWGLVPATMGVGDEWTLYYGDIYSPDWSLKIYCNTGSKTFGFESSGYPGCIYKEIKPVTMVAYYMTEVLTGGEVADYSAKNIIIKDSRRLNVTGRLEMNANGLFRNENVANFVFADGAQFYYTGEESVEATFEKEIEAYTGTNDNYYFIANPTDATYVSNLENIEWVYDPETDEWNEEVKFDLYTFDPTEELEWQNQILIDNTSIERNAGYLYANAATTTLQFRGELLPAGEATIDDLKYYDGNEAGHEFPGFNLVGNPFACNAYVQNYSFYTIEGDAVVAGTGAIAPCEGFFVEATATGQSVTLSTTVPAPTSLLNITVSQNRGNVIDRAIVNFDGANNLHKFMMNPAHTNLCIAKGGETFAAISTEAEGELPVNFKAEKDGTYTISVNTENVEANYLHLIDNLTGMDTDLLSTPSYTFNATTSDYASRFKLVFSMNNDNEDMSQANSFAYINNGEIVISNEGRATLQVIDVLGRIVSSEEINGECRISTNGMTAGLYILNLNGMTQKIVVR